MTNDISQRSHDARVRAKKSAQSDPATREELATLASERRQMKADLARKCSIHGGKEELEAEYRKALEANYDQANGAVLKAANRSGGDHLTRHALLEDARTRKCEELIRTANSNNDYFVKLVPATSFNADHPRLAATGCICLASELDGTPAESLGKRMGMADLDQHGTIVYKLARTPNSGEVTYLGTSLWPNGEPHSTNQRPTEFPPATLTPVHQFKLNSEVPMSHRAILSTGEAFTMETFRHAPERRDFVAGYKDKLRTGGPVSITHTSKK